MATTSAPQLLIIDDNLNNLYSFKQMLADMDVEIIVADSGEKGLQILFDRIFALILLDVQMPGMSGFEVAKHIRKDSKNDMTPIVFITAFTQDLEKIKEAYEDGATDFIQKPIEVDIFRSKIQNYIKIYNLRKDKQMLDSLLDLNTDGWWEWNLSKSNKSMYFNPGLKNLLGCKEYELDGNSASWDNIIYPEDLDKFNTAIKNHLDSDAQIPISIELRFKHKSGLPIWIICKGYALKDEAGKFYKVVGFLTNINQQKETELELAQANQELEQFVYIASHDLQEPLRTITSYIDMFEFKFKDLVATNPEAAKYMGYITQSANKMIALIKGVLSISRIGKDHEFTNIDLNQVIQSVLEDLKASIEQNHVNIEVDKLPSVKGVRIELYQLFLNLISNSIKFKSDKNPLIKIKVEKRRSDYLFTISDNGIGMEPQHYKKVFEIFHRLKKAKDVPGTGIGLALCKKIIEHHNGNIWIESKVNEGTNFCFTFQATNNLENSESQAYSTVS